MEKILLNELLRMKQIMGYDKSNPTKILIEQKPDSFEPEEPKPQEEGMGVFERYGKFKIGGNTNKEYPTIMDKPINIIVEPGKPPILKRFQTGDTAKKFIDDVKEFKEGDKLANGDVAQVGQEYIEYGGVKYCLPVKEWWNEWTSKGYIYQFKNGKTLTDFTMRLSLQLYVNVQGALLKGTEASQNCKGGDNGWGFSMASPTGMVFYKKDGSGETYGIDKSELIATSDYDDWWNGYGSMITEFGIAIVANLAAPGIGGLLVGMAEAMIATQRAIRLARFILMLSQKSYTLFGRSKSVWLPLITESVTEGTLMSPIIYNLWQDGKKSEAMLGMIMCFLPFFVSAKIPQKLINDGSKIGGSNVGDLLIKMESFGGISAIQASEKTTSAFLKTLNKTEQAAYLAAVQILAKDPKAAYKTLNDVLAQQGDEIFDILVKKADDVEPGLGKKILNFTNRNLNLLSGKGRIPKLTRALTLVMGGVVIPLKWDLDRIFNKIKVDLKPEQIQNLMKKYQETLQKSNYVTTMVKLNDKLGLNNNEKLLTDIAEYQLIKNPDIAKTALWSQEDIEKDAKNIALRDKKLYEKSINEWTQDKELLGMIDDLAIFASREEMVSTILLNNNLTLSDWVDTKTDRNKWTFVLTDGKNGEVNFKNDGTFDVFVDGKLLNKV